MENEEFLNQIPAHIRESASVKSVFGEPIRAGDKVILPVAQVAYGFGGGFGKGNATKKVDSNKNESGEGGGGGGGMFATAKGVYVISPKSTKYIAASNARQIVFGIAIGYLVRGLLLRNKKR